MLNVSAENRDYIISGYISLPEIHRSNRNGMVTLVNGRIVKNTEINRIINEAYHSYKPDNRYPIVVLNIEALKEEIKKYKDFGMVNTLKCSAVNYTMVKDKAFGFFYFLKLEK